MSKQKQINEEQIARIWQGRTEARHCKEDIEFMRLEAIPDHKRTEGSIKLTFLRRVEGNIAHFNLITFWQDLDVIKNVARGNYGIAK